MQINSQEQPFWNSFTRTDVRESGFVLVESMSGLSFALTALQCTMQNPLGSDGSLPSSQNDGDGNPILKDKTSSPFKKMGRALHLSLADNLNFLELHTQISKPWFQNSH